MGRIDNQFGIMNNFDFLIFTICDVGDCGGEEDVDKLRLLLVLFLFFFDYLIIYNFYCGYDSRRHGADKLLSAVQRSPRVAMPVINLA